MARLGKIGLFAFIASSLSLPLPTLVAGAAPLVGPSPTIAELPVEVSGTVFVDDNGDGILSPGEGGVPGVTVAVAASAPTEATVEVRTGLDGSYAATVAAGAVRVTFSGWPASLEPAPITDDRVGSSVQFVTAPAATNFGLHAPGNYCGEAERIALACFLFGAADGRNAGAPSLYDIPTGSEGKLADIPGATPAAPLVSRAPS